MCGIAAIFAYDDDRGPIDDRELSRIHEQMKSRGPDGEGVWLDSCRRIGMAHRRLSIIDLSPAASQPMVSQDGRYVIVFNGEIYNFKELRAELERKGYCFLSRSDTEVILALYSRQGVEMLPRLRGMFALAIWDNLRQGLLIARDPFGIKPLYWADSNGVLRIASQVKALLAGKGVDTTPDPAGQVGFLMWGHVPEPYTLYRTIRSLPPGSWIWADKTGIASPQRFFSISALLAEASRSSAAQSNPVVIRQVREALRESVASHLVSDVPVGVFLSAGIDSSAIAALASESGGELKTVTLGFSEYAGSAGDEVPVAEKFAARLSASHSTVRVDRRHFESCLDHILESMDQPSIDGINSYFVSKAAVQAGLKVALSGLGGDELFAGYSTFRQVPKIRAMSACTRPIPWLGRSFRWMAMPLAKYFASPKYAGLLEYGSSLAGGYLLCRGLFMPWELPELLDGDCVRQGLAELQTVSELHRTIDEIGDDRRRLMALESCWYMRNQLLRDADWASMAHSIEIRVPLVDTRLWQQVAPVLGRKTANRKHLLVTAPQPNLPAEIWQRAKSGFGIPVREWLGREQNGHKDRGLRDWAKFLARKFFGNDR